MAVELLHDAVLHGHADRGHRDAHHAAHRLAHARHGLHQGPFRDRQTDGHLIHHVVMKHVDDILHRAQHRPADGQRRIVRLGQVSDDPQAQRGMALHAVGELLGRGSRAHDERVAGITATPTQPLEAPPQRDAHSQGEYHLGREEHQQEAPAHIAEAEQEEDGEGEHGHDRRGGHDVQRLATDGPASAQPVEASQPQHEDPAAGIDQGGEPREARGRAHHRGPVAVADAQPGDQHEEGCGAGQVDAHEGHAQRGRVPSDHGLGRGFTARRMRRSRAWGSTAHS